MGTKQFSNYSDLLTFTRASKGHALRPVSYGTELVENGDFSDTDLSDWASFAATLTVSSGELVVTNSSTAFGRAYQGVTTEVGKLYQFSCDVNYTGDGGRIRLGTTSAGSEIYEQQSITEDKTVVVNFVATTTTTYIRLGLQANTSGNSIQFDNASLKEVTFDQPDGTLTLFEHPDNIPRVEWDADRNRLGLLVEEQRVNLVTHSEDFSDSSWNNAASGLTVISNAITAPDGTMTADKLQETATSSVHRRGFLVSSSNDKIFSFFAKAGERTKVRTWSFVGSNTYAVTFDLSNGTIVSGSNTGKEGKIEYYGNGWYRCSSKTFDGQAYVVVGPMIDGESGDHTVNYTGDGSSGVYVWGAQIEDNVSFPTSYIKTTGSTAIRSADVASIPVADFGYNTAVGSVVAEYYPTAVDGIIRTVFELANDINDRLYSAAATNKHWFAKNNNVVVANIDLGTSTEDQLNKIAGAYKKNSFAASLDGGSVTADTSGPVQTGITDLHIGGVKNSSTNYLSGYIKSIQYYPRRLTNAQLEALTEPRSTPTLSLTFDGLESSYTENYIHG